MIRHLYKLISLFAISVRQTENDFFPQILMGYLFLFCL